MNEKDFTKLAFLAEAVARNPDRFDEFVAVVEGKVGADVRVEISPELEDAISGMKQAWRVTDGEPTLEDVVSLAKALDEQSSEPRKLAALALLSAVEGRLARKRHEQGLDRQDRDLVKEVGDLASSV
jgi:hypothetical protein